MRLVALFFAVPEEDDDCLTVESADDDVWVVVAEKPKNGG